MLIKFWIPPRTTLDEQFFFWERQTNTAWGDWLTKIRIKKTDHTADVTIPQTTYVPKTKSTPRSISRPCAFAPAPNQATTVDKVLLVSVVCFLIFFTCLSYAFISLILLWVLSNPCTSATILWKCHQTYPVISPRSKSHYYPTKNTAPSLICVFLAFY